jgi:hypothetical protein
LQANEFNYSFYCSISVPEVISSSHLILLYLADQLG